MNILSKLFNNKKSVETSGEKGVGAGITTKLIEFNNNKITEAEKKMEENSFRRQKERTNRSIPAVGRLWMDGYSAC